MRGVIPISPIASFWIHVRGANRFHEFDIEYTSVSGGEFCLKVVTLHRSSVNWCVFTGAPGLLVDRPQMPLEDGIIMHSRQ
jgi:hypothetical protein